VRDAGLALAPPSGREAPEPPASPFAVEESGRLRVVAPRARSGRPASRARVDVVPFTDPTGGRRRFGGLADAGGQVALEGIPAGPVVVFAGGASRYWSVDPGPGSVVAIETGLALEVEGIVIDDAGVPVAGAPIWLAAPGSVDRGDIVCATGADGRFRLEDVARGRSLSARADGFAWTDRQELPGDGGSPGSYVRFVLGEPARRVRGSVMDGGGLPVAGAWIACRRVEPGPPVVEASTAPDGSFEAGGLTAGEWLLEAWEPGCAPTLRRLRVGGSDPDPVSIALEPGARVEGTVRDERGRPLPRVRVSAVAADFIGHVVPVMTSEAGSFTLEHVPAARILAKAGRLTGSAVAESLDLSTAGHAVWNPVVRQGAVLTGVVRDERGIGREFTRVRATARDERRCWIAETAADRSGFFEIADCPDGDFDVDLDVVRWGDGGTWSLHGVRAGQRRIEVVIPEDARPSAFISGLVLAPDGVAPLDAAVGAARPTDPSRPPLLARARGHDGSFRIGPLSPGAYAVVVQASSGARTTLAECTVAAGEELDLGARVVDREGFLKVSLKRRRGAPGSQRLIVLDRSSRRVAALRPVADFAASGPMSPGSYVLRLEGAGVKPADLPFEIRAGDTTSVEIPIEAAN
jgi:hypothetical protein